MGSEPQQMIGMFKVITVLTIGPSTSRSNCFRKTFPSPAQWFNLPPFAIPAKAFG